MEEVIPFERNSDIKSIPSCLAMWSTRIFCGEDSKIFIPNMAENVSDRMKASN